MFGGTEHTFQDGAERCESYIELSLAASASWNHHERISHDVSLLFGFEVFHIGKACRPQTFRPGPWGVPATGTWIDWICLRTVKSSSDQPDGSVATEDTEATAATAATAVTGDELL
jgi:hypothetical protein